MGELLGGLGITGNLAALIWAAYGGWLIAEKMRGAKNGGSHTDRVFIAEQIGRVESAIKEGYQQIQASIRNSHEQYDKEMRAVMTAAQLNIEIALKESELRRRP